MKLSKLNRYLHPIKRPLYLACFLLSSTFSYAYTPSEQSQSLLKEAHEQGAIKVLVTVKQQPKQALAKAQLQIINAISHKNLQASYAFKYIPMLAMTVTESGLKALINNPNVVTLEQDQLYRNASGGSSAISKEVINAYHSTKNNGGRWAVAVIDSGVDTSHFAFNNRIIDEACYSSNDVDNSGRHRGNYYSLCPGSTVEKPVRKSTSKGSGINCHNELQRLSGELKVKIRKNGLKACNHGTQVAGVVTGLYDNSQSAKFDADIIAIQVNTGIKNNGSLSASSFASDIIKGLERVLTLSKAKKHKIAAVNISISALTNNKKLINSSAVCKTARNGNLTTNKGLRIMVKKLKKAGIATVIAAGNNDATDGVGLFSCIKDAITVGAVNYEDKRWDVCKDVLQFDFNDARNPTKYNHTSPVYETVFEGPKAPFLRVRNCGSNSGKLMDFWALGAGVTTTGISNKVLHSKSGTSYAAPLVASAWATMKAKYPKASYRDIENAFRKTGKIISVAGVSRPRIDLKKALAALRSSQHDDDKITPIRPASNDVESSRVVSFKWKDIKHKVASNVTRSLYTVMVRKADTNKRVYFKGVPDTQRNCRSGTCLKRLKLKSGNYKWQVGYYEDYRDGSFRYFLKSRFIHFSVK